MSFLARRGVFTFDNVPHADIHSSKFHVSRHDLHFATKALQVIAHGAEESGWWRELGCTAVNSLAFLVFGLTLAADRLIIYKVTVQWWFVRCLINCPNIQGDKKEEIGNPRRD